MRGYTSSTGAYSWQSYRKPTACGIDTVSTYSGGFTKSERARGNLIQGNHNTPTYYTAYEWKLTPLEFDYWETKNSRSYCSGKWNYFNLAFKGTKQSSVNKIHLDSGRKPVVPLSVKLTARNKVLAELRAGKVNLAQTTGELTLGASQMVQSAITAIRGLNAIRKGQFAKARQIFGISRSKVDKTAANAYLGFKYGWYPLMQDIYNLRQSLIDIMSRHFLLSVEATHVDQRGPFYIGNYYISGKLERGMQCGISYKVDDLTLAGMNSLGFIDPASLAWELTPYSFIYDWFFTVGDFISGLSAPLGLQFATGYETSFVNTNAEMTDMFYNTSSYDGQFPHWMLEEFAMERVVLTTWSKPGIVFKLGLNPNQLATLAAMLVQRSR